MHRGLRQFCVGTILPACPSIVRLEPELLLAAELTPERIDQFQRDLPTEWIEEALYATGTATVRRRRLPAEHVVWPVMGMALMRDRHRWRGLALYGVDGSTLRVADSEPARRRRAPQRPAACFFRRAALAGAFSVDVRRFLAVPEP